MKLVLATGRKITLASLDQWRTYGGLLAGKPERAVNESHVEDLLKLARKSAVIGAEPILLQPAEEALNGRLPAVSCLAVFESGQLARADSEPYSSLTVAWFQDDFALPLELAVEAQICAVDWEAVAKDWIP